MWNKKQKDAVEERKRKDAEVAAFLKSQIDEKKRKEGVAMNEAEVLLNKSLLKEISEKKKAMRSTSRTNLQTP